MKRITTLLFALALIFILPLHAYASTIGITEYFRLTPGIQRLDDMGRFTFEIYSNKRSDHNFKTISNSITVEASAQVYNDDPSVESPRNEDDVFFTIYLYKVGLSSPVGKFTHPANGTLGSKTFGVETGVEYYFMVEPSGLHGWDYLIGSGDFSNIYLV